MMKRIKTLVVICLACMAFGCGSTGGDTGSSFTFFGFYMDSTGKEGCDGLSAPLAALIDTGNSFDLIPAAGLQNNITGQYIRVQRLFISYNIVGLATVPPLATFPLSQIIGPAAMSNAGTGVDTSLPDNAGSNTKGMPNIVYAEFSIIPQSMRTWLRNNQGILPARPFVLEATVQARGTTSSGDEVDTNTGTLLIEIL
jgi:hypothetical protein